MTNPRTRVTIAALAAAATFGSLVTTTAYAADDATLPPTDTVATSTTAPTADPVPGAGKALGKSRTKAPHATRGIDATVRPGKAADAARAHLADHADTYKIDAATMRALSTTSSSKGRSAVRLQQTFAGLPVFGAQYVVQTQAVDGGVRVESTTGTVFTELSGSMTAAVSESVARERLHLDGTVASVADPTIESQGLVVLPIGAGSPAWQFEVSGTSESGEPVRQQVFVDARVGGIALSYTKIHTAEAPGEPAEATGTTFRGDAVTLRVTKNAEGRFELRDQSRAMHATTGGELRTLDALGRDYTAYSGTLPADTPIFSSATDSFDAAASSIGAIDAHVNAGKVYEFFRNELGRNGVDGQGGTMTSVVNVTSGGKEYGNAFWDGTKMVYGSSKGVPFSSTLDVVGHEMSHGVTEHGANLLYINQSGALNEAISDYFGNAMETEDLGIPMTDPTAGLIGEYLCTDKTPEKCAIRDLNDERVAGDDYVLLSVDYDNGGVHVNSTIIGGALWDIREQLGGPIADRLVYAAQTEYLTPLSDFSDMRTAVEYAAKREHLSADQLAVITKAFDDHGVFVGWEESTQTNDATILRTDIVSTYEGWGPTDDSAGAVDGDRWATSEMDIAAFFAGSNDFSITTGEFGKPAKTRTINQHNAWDLDPAMDAGRLVWTRISADGVDVVEQKGSGLGGVNIVAGGEGDQYRPAVSGTTTAWLDARGAETDVWVKVGTEPARNLTPEPGTKATKVVVRGDVLAWSTTSAVNTVDLSDGRTATQRVPGWIFNKVTDLDLTSRGLFFRLDGLQDALYFAEPFALSRYTKIRTPKNLYSAQFTVNEAYVVYTATTAWGELTYPVGTETPKLMIAPVEAAIAGTAVWERASCGTGAQISPQLGDGARLMWLDTSLARTDLVTRNGIAGGTC